MISAFPVSPVLPRPALPTSYLPAVIDISVAVLFTIIRCSGTGRRPCDPIPGSARASGGDGRDSRTLEDGADGHLSRTEGELACNGPQELDSIDSVSKDAPLIPTNASSRSTASTANPSDSLRRAVLERSNRSPAQSVATSPESTSESPIAAIQRRRGATSERARGRSRISPLRRVSPVRRRYRIPRRTWQIHW